MRILKMVVASSSKMLGGVRSAMGGSRKAIGRGWLKHGTAIKQTLKAIGIGGASAVVANAISNAFQDDETPVQMGNGRYPSGSNRAQQAQSAFIPAKDTALDSIRACYPHSQDTIIVETARAIAEFAVMLQVASPEKGDLFLTTMNDLGALARLGGLPQVKRHSELLTNHMVNRSESDRTEAEVKESLTVAHQLATVSKISLLVN